MNYALRTRLHYKPANVQYVPHILTVQDKIQRVQYCKELRNDETMNSNTFIINVLKPIKKYRCFIQTKSRNKRFTYILIIALLIRPNVSEYLAQKKFSIAPHPAYSRDLSPSDFYLFGKLKDKLEGIEFQNENEIEQAINLRRFLARS